LSGQVGPRGLTILLMVAAAGILLAIVGWTQRGTGQPRTEGTVGYIVSTATVR
jgi:hypothetical protein